ncbi:hypothetical protein [Pseudomonas sp. BBP2017]|uniref:hypothetical protein n=1 Tax=Pseudomonas sp. BBP2017 TaxID=2109731 RepID=UPI0015A7CB00|nr:hypothetical protein [Pseudomonas sp. BBP2017]
MLEYWQAHLTFTLLAFVLVAFFNQRTGLKIALLAGFLAVSFLPVDGLPLAAYLRGVTDDVATTTLVGLLYAALVRMGVTNRLQPVSRVQLLLLFSGLALVLYPSTLGLTYFDPYRLGYNPRPLLLGIGLLTLVFILVRNGLVVCMLGLATLAFSLQLKPSPNYWDYLLDPFIAVYCWTALIVTGLKTAWFSAMARRKLKLEAEL